MPDDFWPDARRARRIECNMRAWVTLPNAPGFVCNVADISITGCRIVAREMPDLPERLTLTILDADLSAECERVWQRPFSAGLKFIARGTQADAPPPPEPQKRKRRVYKPDLAEPPPETDRRDRVEI